MAETVVIGSSPAGPNTAYTLNVASDLSIFGSQNNWRSSSDTWQTASGDWNTNTVLFAAAYTRAFNEVLAFSEQIAKHSELKKSESLNILETMKRNAAAVISDILIGTSDIDALQFQALLDQDQAVGYGPFVSFMEGDHEYQSALFKTVVTSQSVSAGRLTALALSADVPDVFDVGSIAVPSIGVTVNFNKNFYIAPEVTASIKGGTVYAVPIISNITLTSFKVELRDASNALVAGNVSWSAQGY